MSKEEIIANLAALMYYQSKPKRKKGEPKEPPVSFEALTDEQRAPFYELAQNVFVQLDQLNLKVVSRESEKTTAAADSILREKIESTIKKFLSEIKVWRKDMFPEQELIERVWQVWVNL